MKSFKFKSNGFQIKQIWLKNKILIWQHHLLVMN